MERNIKNERIRKSIAETRQRHKEMLCKVFEIKIVDNKLSREKREHLDRLFLEANWLKNMVIESGDPFSFPRLPKIVAVQVGDTFEERRLSVLSSHMKQDIVDSVKADIRSLSKGKAAGQKVGRIGCRSQCNMIPLRKFGSTYRIDRDSNTVTIQRLRKPIKVTGIEQIPVDAEIANAKLIRKPTGLFFHVTTYSVRVEQTPTGFSEGLDMGIINSVTLSTDKKHNIYVPETKSVILASRAVDSGYKNNGRVKSSNHKKRVNRLRVAYERQTNKKVDANNKLVSKLLGSYDFLAVQDEMIASWQKGLFGKQVRHSALGTIKAKLKANSKVHIVPRNFPSTQKCPICGKKTKHPMSKRDYECSYCGYYHPSRDAKSAALILKEAQKVCVERTAHSPEEDEPSDRPQP